MSNIGYRATVRFEQVELDRFLDVESVVKASDRQSVGFNITPDMHPDTIAAVIMGILHDMCHGVVDDVLYPIEADKPREPGPDDVDDGDEEGDEDARAPANACH